MKKTYDNKKQLHVVELLKLNCLTLSYNEGDMKSQSERVVYN